MSVPENTSKASPLEKLVTVWDTNGQGIEAQEAAGARQMVLSTVLPVQGSEDPRFAELGFVLGDVVEGDDLFRHAELPVGWSRKGTGHSMWTDVVDERGITRVAVFYKAAFYDRSANMQIVNVGYKLAQDIIYGDVPLEEIAVPGGYLHAELRDAKASAKRYVEQASDALTGHVYADRLPRAQRLLDILNAVVSDESVESDEAD